MENEPDNFQSSIFNLQFLQEQIDSLPGASISTVHAFCAKVVSRHFHLVGLSPAATTMDETQGAVSRAAMLEECLTDCAVNRAETYRLLVGALGGEWELAQELTRLYHFLQSLPEPLRWLEEVEAKLGTPQQEAAIQEAFLASQKEDLRLHLDETQARRDSLPAAQMDVRAHVDGELLRLRGALLAQTVTDYWNALTAVNFDTLRFPKDSDEGTKKPLQAARDALKKIVRKQLADGSRSLLGFGRTQELSDEVTRALCEEVKRFLTAYRDRKRQENVLDFGDLEHYTLEILAHPAVAEEFRHRYQAIIIDEYQDSNRVQESILNAIARPNNLFFVGDAKQSIYGFRQADVSLFVEKLAGYHGDAGQVVHLSANFRSAKAVIDAVNRVFETVMQDDDLRYDANAALRMGREQEEGVCELHLIEDSDFGFRDPEWDETLSHAEAEARFAVRKIRELMEEKNYRYEDFVILLRNSTHARAWAHVLAQAGVPCFAQLSGGYFDAIEVQVAENLLRVLDNRRQDIPLLSVLRSGFGGFSDSELAEIRQVDREGNFIDCLTNCRSSIVNCRLAFAIFCPGWMRFMHNRNTNLYPS